MRHRLLCGVFARPFGPAVNKVDFPMSGAILLNSCYLYHFRNRPICCYLQRIITVVTILPQEMESKNCTLAPASLFPV